MRKWFKNLFKPKKQIQIVESKGGETAVMLGFHARQLINNPAFDAAIKKIEADLFNAWKMSPPKMEKEREHLYYRMEGLAQIKLKLTGMMNNMILEEQAIKQRERQSRREAQGE